MAAGPASAQLADPLSLAASGVLLPFFSDPASGFVSIFEIASPVVGTSPFPPFPPLTNPIHAVFFSATCARDGSAQDVQTQKQAKAYISSSTPFLLNFNGLAAIGSSVSGNDLLPLNFPIHSRVHWIDVSTGRLRELEPIILDTFFSLNSEFLPLVINLGAGASVGLCNTFPFDGFVGNNGFCWSPLRSAATFVTPQEGGGLAATLYLICPRSTIQSPTGGIFPGTIFPLLFNRDGSTGFPSSNVITGNSVSVLRGRIYDDDETLVRDIQIPCDCLTVRTVASIDGVYSLPPTNLGAHTVPVWYTELEVQTVNPNPVVPASRQFSFTGYWGLEVAGHEGTLFHRLSNASLDNLSPQGVGFSVVNFNQFGNR
jgi:hypothetical protein